jgi:predicted O-methyltransferase YrrM
MAISKYLQPRNYVNKLSMYWDKLYHESRYDAEGFRKLERRKFAEAGFDYDRGLEKLDQTLAQLGKPPFLDQRGMASVHWILFSSMSLIYDVKRVLEIGTFDGETTRILSELFVDASVTTVDLPGNDPILANSYRRAEPEQVRMFAERQRVNTRHPRIELIQANSFQVPVAAKGKFDLIWIDGGHLYPEIAWDICNAYHLCNTGGWIMCDDVIPSGKGFRNEYVSTDSSFVLDYVSRRTGEKVVFFMKREGAEWSANPNKRKYVALMHRDREWGGR